MHDAEATGPDRVRTLLEIYEHALPEVFGYLVRRCPNEAVAEDLTADTFLAALDACGRGTVSQPTVAWLVAVARNKLVDHWRRVGREERKLHLLEGAAPPDEEWQVELEETRVRATMEALTANHRAALTLRYFDRLSVPEVAAHLGRSVHATESLLVRAKAAFRTAYEGRAGDD